MAKFELDQIFLADFVSHDANGKSLIIGAYREIVRLSEVTPIIPQLWAQIIIKPIEAPFRFSVSFHSPVRSPELTASARFEGIGPIPPEHRILMNFQLPPVDFQDGIYRITVADEAGELVGEQAFRMTTERPPQFVGRMLLEGLTTAEEGGAAASK